MCKSPCSWLMAQCSLPFCVHYSFYKKVFPFRQTTYSQLKKKNLKNNPLPKSKLLFTFEVDLERYNYMKYSELFRLLKKDGWYPVSQIESHIKMKHDQKEGIIIFPNHGNQKVGKGLEKKILKDAGVNF